MIVVTNADELPPLEKTKQLTRYKGHLPVIIFSVEEHRDYSRGDGEDWKGFRESRELARSYFEDHAECERVEMLFLNEDDSAGTEASFVGSYLRSHFEPGRRYAREGGRAA